MNTRALVRGISGKSLLAFAGIVLLLGVVTGQAAAVTVSGTVTNNGVGVANLYVVATTPAPNFTFLAQAQTHASGNYAISLPNMPESTQFLVFVDLTGTRLVAALNDTIEKTVTFPSDPLVTEIKGVDFRLVDGVKLSGTVTNRPSPTTSSPASGVIVFATNPSMGYKFLGQVTTGGDGTYNGLLVPPNETAELAVDTQGKFPGTVVDPAFIDVSIPAWPTSDISGKNFSLIPGVTVQGTVQYIDGSGSLKPISNALVEAFYVATTGWVWLGDDTTGPNGFYSVAVALEWGEILLRVTATEFVERRVEVKLDSPMPDVNIVLSWSVQISGRVTDAFTNPPIGIAGVPVEAYFGELFYWENTDLNGYYTLDVPPNQGLVTIHVDATSIDYLQPGDGEVVVGIVDFTGIDFALTPAVRITGTVINAETGIPIQGAGVTAFQGSFALAFDLTESSGPNVGKYLLKVAVNQGSVDIHVDAGSFYQTANQFITVGTTNQEVDFALKPVVQNDEVTIQTATWTWSKNQLRITATNQVAGAKLFASVVDTAGNLVRDNRGNFVLNDVQMTFKNRQYQIGKKTTVNLCTNDAWASVRSDKGTTPDKKRFCQP